MSVDALYARLHGSHPAFRAILAGFALWLLGFVLWLFSGILPNFVRFIDEAIFFAVVVGLGAYLWFNRTKGTAIGVIFLVSIGYWIVPGIAKASYFLSTSSTFTGQVVDVYNDESTEGGVRRTFVIQNTATGVTDEYVSRDAILFPFVFHTDSARTRRNMVPGATMEFKEYGTRRFKDQIPVIGNFLGLGYISGDWSAFPNIYSAELITAPENPQPTTSD